MATVLPAAMIVPTSGRSLKTGNVGFVPSAAGATLPSALPRLTAKPSFTEVSTVLLHIGVSPFWFLVLTIGEARAPLWRFVRAQSIWRARDLWRRRAR